MTSTNSPHLRHLRAVVYVKVMLVAGATVVGSFIDKDWESGAALLEATQFLGLEALALLLASMTIGPLTAVFPRLPLRDIPCQERVVAFARSDERVTRSRGSRAARRDAAAVP